MNKIVEKIQLFDIIKEIIKNTYNNLNNLLDLKLVVAYNVFSIYLHDFIWCIIYLITFSAINQCL